MFKIIKSILLKKHKGDALASIPIMFTIMVTFFMLIQTYTYISKTTVVNSVELVVDEYLLLSQYSGYVSEEDVASLTEIIENLGAKNISVSYTDSLVDFGEYITIEVKCTYMSEEIDVMQQITSKYIEDI